MHDTILNHICAGMLEICLTKAVVVESKKKKSKSWHKHKPKSLLTETKSTRITVYSLLTEAQQRTGTFHSSQLTPIYPGAFKNSSENRGSEREISATSSALEDQRNPEGGRQKALHSPQCSAAKWNNANQALIATSLEHSSQLAAITFSVNLPKQKAEQLQAN